MLALATDVLESDYKLSSRFAKVDEFTNVQPFPAPPSTMRTLTTFAVKLLKL